MYSGPMMYPMPTAMGDIQMPKKMFFAASPALDRTGGIRPHWSRRAVNRAARPVGMNIFAALPPPSSPACTVCAAAWPMGKGSFCTSMK